jgi:hypothetical protein
MKLHPEHFNKATLEARALASMDELDSLKDKAEKLDFAKWDEKFVNEVLWENYKRFLK